ncbi:hypothetical protein [Variovorax sp. PBL-E5]|uniref:hypothetical protein n=1 Tax=Variovorax sp. PBL-E5 TaxID=434014 RepID=UPI001318298B|nr:hypothetical protein [Variovorax sp. PBL-E5]VTU30021.1 hypothetical protein E5CHR_02929 [Variovorax sp. PBL-E5]
MAKYRIDRIRIPDEFRYALRSVSENFAEHAEMEPGSNGITLKGLSPEQSLAHSVFLLTSEVDELIDNLNIVMGDLEGLSEDPRHLHDQNPFNRFQFLFRMFFYEYARFEDLFGYFTKWQQEQGLLTKVERKQSRDGFYAAFEDAFRIRNVLAHDAVEWRQCTMEIGLLQALEATGQTAIDSKGVALSWKDHLGPICTRFAEAFVHIAHPMRTFWNMELAHLALALVSEGRLKKAKKPFDVQHPSFLRSGRPDR